MICESAFTGETTFTLLQLGIKKWYCLGCSCCSKLSLKRDLLRSKLFIHKLWRDINFLRTIPNTSKTLRKLVVCGVESLTLIKTFPLADKAVLDYTDKFPVFAEIKVD